MTVLFGLFMKGFSDEKVERANTNEAQMARRHKGQVFLPSALSRANNSSITRRELWQNNREKVLNDLHYHLVSDMKRRHETRAFFEK